MAINSILSKALLDTGATVSTVSKAFYDQHLSDTELHSIEDTISSEYADGQLLPYVGLIHVDLTPRGVPSLEKIHDCMFLVVPNSHYNAHVY